MEISDINMVVNLNATQLLEIFIYAESFFGIKPYGRLIEFYSYAVNFASGPLIITPQKLLNGFLGFHKRDQPLKYMNERK